MGIRRSNESGTLGFHFDASWPGLPEELSLEEGHGYVSQHNGLRG